jgi:hypothetical protein
MPDPETAPAQSENTEASLAALVQDFIRIENTSELYGFWQHVPTQLEEALMAVVEERIQQAEQEGQAEFARGLRQRLAAFRSLHSQHEAARRSPVAQALMYFLQAPGEDGARHAYAARLAILQTEEAQRVLEEQLRGSNPLAEQRLAERRALLRALRQETDQRLVDFVNAGSPDDMRKMVDASPVLLNEGIEPAFDELLRRYQDDATTTALVEDKRALLRACRAQGAQAAFEALALGTSRLAAFRAAAEAYMQFSEAAEQIEDGADPATWQRAIESGQALLADEWQGMPGVDWDALRESLASDYTSLGSALEDAGDPEAALAAFDLAVATQPGEALWRENQAEMLIGLDRLEEAAQALAAARALNDDSPRLAELETALAARRA